MKITNIVLGVFFFIIFLAISMSLGSLIPVLNSQALELGQGAFILLAFLSLLGGFLIS